MVISIDEKIEALIEEIGQLIEKYRAVVLHKTYSTPRQKQEKGGLGVCHNAPETHQNKNLGRFRR